MSNNTMNRLANAGNPFQGKARRVLCVCSAGLLRSPTCAVVLNREYGFNTRAVGLDADFALIPIDEVLVEWADEIVCMTPEQQGEIKRRFGKEATCLCIPDQFAYMDETLQEMIKSSYGKEE